MLKTIAHILGFSPAPAAPPARPPSRRRTPPTERPVLQAAKATPVPTAPRETYEAKQVRLAEVARVRAEAARDDVVSDGVRLLVRAYDPSDLRYCDPKEVTAAETAVGQPVQQYVRACQLAGLRLPTLSDAQEKEAGRRAAFRAEIEERAVSDFETWDKAWARVLEQQKTARRHGEPVPADLEIPGIVQEGIAALHHARMMRLQRRQGGQAGQTGTVIPGGGPVIPPAPPTGTKKDGEGDEPESSGPAGPK